MSVTIQEPYVVGEKPAPLVYQFLDSTGAVIDLSGYAAEFHIQEKFGSPVVLSATVTDGPNGKVSHSFTGTEFATPGSYRGQFWAGNGSLRYASTAINFTVAAAVGTAPSI